MRWDGRSQRTLAEGRPTSSMVVGDAILKWETNITATKKGPNRNDRRSCRIGRRIKQRPSQTLTRHRATTATTTTTKTTPNKKSEREAELVVLPKPKIKVDFGNRWHLLLLFLLVSSIEDLAAGLRPTKTRRTISENGRPT